MGNYFQNANCSEFSILVMICRDLHQFQVKNIFFLETWVAPTKKQQYCWKVPWIFFVNFTLELCPWIPCVKLNFSGNSRCFFKQDMILLLSQSTLHMVFSKYKVPQIFPVDFACSLSTQISWVNLQKLQALWERRSNIVSFVEHPVQNISKM